MNRPRGRKSAALPLAIASAAIIGGLAVIAIAEPDPAKAHTRTLVRLKAGRSVTVLIAGGSIAPLIPPDAGDNNLPYAWFAAHLQHQYPQAKLALVRNVRAEPAAEQHHELLEPLLKQLRPDITVLCLGSADYLAGTDPDRYDAACASLIATARRMGGFVVVACAILPDESAAAPIVIHTRRNAIENGCTFIDLGTVLRDAPAPIGTLLDDECRLTARGAALVARSLIEAWRNPFAPPAVVDPPSNAR